jgi:hypothetical protein
MSQNYLNGTIDLGNTPEMYTAYRHFGQLSPDETFGALHGSLHHIMADDENIDPEWMKKIAAQAAHFGMTFADQLSDHEKWILKQLQRRPRRKK